MIGQYITNEKGKARLLNFKTSQNFKTSLCPQTKHPDVSAWQMVYSGADDLLLGLEEIVLKPRVLILLMSMFYFALYCPWRKS